MILNFDSHLDELLAKGGTFDITGTSTVEDKQFWGFNAEEGTVINAIFGVPVKTSVTDTDDVRDEEEDIAALILTGDSDELFGGVLYRAPGYIITSIDLTSGSIHGFLLKNQVPAPVGA
jgi:hypothetical protein